MVFIIKQGRRKMKKIILSVFIICIASFLFTKPLPAKNGKKLRLGVLEFDEKNSIGIDKSGVIISEILITHLKNIGKYNLSERALLKEILKEQELQMTGLIDNKTAVKVGKIYGLDAIAVGSSMKIVNTITISGRIISVKTGEIIASGVIKFENAENLEDELEGLAYQLSGTSKDEFLRIKAARQIAKSRYGVKVGTGYATSGAYDYNDSKNKIEEMTISGWAPLYLSLFYYGEYIDFEFFGFPPPSHTTVIGAVANINPFTHFGIGFGYLSTKQEESSDNDAPYVEAKSVIVGVNYRATARLRASLYFGMALSAKTNFTDRDGYFFEYESTNSIGNFPPAAMLLSIEYMFTDHLSGTLIYCHNGGDKQGLNSTFDISNTAAGRAPSEVESETYLLVFAVGYSFTL